MVAEVLGGEGGRCGRHVLELWGDGGWRIPAALAGETGVIRFLRTDKIRWLRAGDSEDQPEWGESLLVSVSRRIEDLHKILGIDGMVQTLAGFTTYYVDHQLPDTVP